MNIVAPFFKQCTQTPQQIAFAEEQRSITYSDLKKQVETVAAFLQQQSITQRCIAVALDRGIDSALCIYAILSAGGIYLPLDIKNPAPRLNFIIQDAQPQYVIGLGAAPAWLDESEQWLDLNQILEDKHTKYKAVDTSPSDLAAILYTSGSTGNPKGVALSHQALHNFSSWAKDTFKLQAADRIASLAPFHFDLSIFDLFSSLSAGASVYFIPAKLTFAPSKLTAWLSENKINFWYTVPSLLSFIALKGALESTPLNHLKCILFAGEVFPSKPLIKLVNLLPNTLFYNLYGPTETNVCCYWKVDKKRLSLEQTIPIGIPACNATLKLDNTSNELLVHSLNNFSGYWQQGKLAPLTQTYYATGDKASLNSFGEYEYHGRLDRMLKCSGYRVEPAEIEHAINQLEHIDQSAVIGIKDATSGQRPAAAVILKNNAELGPSIKPLRQLLPPYMQPCKFIVLESLPVLSNGKTDYLAIEKIFKS